MGESLPAARRHHLLQKYVADLRVESRIVEYFRGVLRFDPGREGAQRRLDALPELVEHLGGVAVNRLLGEDRLVGVALLLGLEDGLGRRALFPLGLLLLVLGHTMIIAVSRRKLRAFFTLKYATFPRLCR